MILQDRFQAFDWGEEENQRRYKSSQPTQVDLKKATPPMAIYVAPVMIILSLATLLSEMTYPRGMTTLPSQRTTLGW